MGELGNSMTELLTESFCERCGTRYTFEASERRRGGTSRLRVLSLGLRTFIANDDTSLSEAMAAARNDEERAIAARQMDAFHRTFNFCFSCRQYICANCWNDLAGTCLTCNQLEIDQYERSASLEAAPPIAQVGGAAQAFAAPAAVQPADESAVAGGPASGLSSPGAVAPSGSAGLLRPRLEAVAWPRADTATPATVDEAADVEPAVAATGSEAPREEAEGSEAAAEADASREEAAIAQAVLPGPMKADASPDLATSADELTADELQTIREALSAGPSEVVAATSSAEPDAESVAAAAEPDVAAAAEPEATETSEEVAAPDAEAAQPAAEPDVAATPEGLAEPEAELEVAAVAAEAAPAETEAPALEPQAAAGPDETPAPEPVAPPSSPPSQSPEAPVPDGGRAAAPGRSGRFGRLRTGGLLDRYRPAASDSLRTARGAPGAVTAPAAGGDAEPTAAISAGDAPSAEAAPANRIGEPAPDHRAERAAAAVEEPAPPPAEPARSRRPSRAEPPATTPVAATRDVVSQPVWSVVAPDTDEEPARPWTPGPRPAQRPLDLPPSAWAARLATARPDDVWTISAQDVVTTQAGTPAPSVQPCVKCGLALSANARFCRRCGAGQG